MFDNIVTALIQAVGFFSVFGFFLYQLLSSDKRKVNASLNFEKKSEFNPKNLNVKPKKKGIFNRKSESIKKEGKPKKKGWFN